jgi:cytochrome P450
MFRPDPHAGFARLRPVTPAITFGDGVPQLIRYADVAALITDPRTRQIETEPLTVRGVTSGPLYDFYANSMLLANPPRHARRRGPAARAFAHKIIEAWRPRIRTLVEGLVDAGSREGEFDFLERIATPLPATLIADALGAPREDAPWFSDRVRSMTRGLGGFRPEDLPAIDAACADLSDYVARLLAARRQAPQDDFLTEYLARVDEAGDLSAAETLMQILTIIIGGSDTTRFALTMMVSELVQDRRQWEAVVANPGLAAGAVLEILRYEPPVGAIGRVALEDMEIEGMRFGPGTPITISLLSAQRDEAVFAEPNRFDIARPDHPRHSLTFGLAPHRCLGEALACAELEEALIALATRLPSLRLVGDPSRAKGHGGVRAVTELRVAV